MNFGRTKFQSDIITACIRWYLSYPSSYRNIEEMMVERGIHVGHATINRWVIKFAPKLEKKFRNYKKIVGGSWRLDETYVKVSGVWHYLYRAVDKAGDTIDFLLTKRRSKHAAFRFLKKAIPSNCLPEKINIDGSMANENAIIKYNDLNGKNIEIRRCKYLNNIVEQDHRNIKRLTRYIQTFKSFDSAKATLAGIEMVNMLRKGQDFLGRLFVQNHVQAFHATQPFCSLPQGDLLGVY